MFQLHTNLENLKMNDDNQLCEEGLRVKEDLKVSNGKLQVYERVFFIDVGCYSRFMCFNMSVSGVLMYTCGPIQSIGVVYRFVIA